jgi:hypothetical protein
MNDLRRSRARTIGIAIACVVTTSFAWLGAVVVMWLAHAYSFPAARLLVVGRVLARTAALLAFHSLPVLMIMLLVAGLVLWSSGVWRPARAREGSVRHA